MPCFVGLTLCLASNINLHLNSLLHDFFHALRLRRMVEAFAGVTAALGAGPSRLLDAS